MNKASTTLREKLKQILIKHYQMDFYQKNQTIQ